MDRAAASFMLRHNATTADQKQWATDRLIVVSEQLEHERDQAAHDRDQESQRADQAEAVIKEAHPAFELAACPGPELIHTPASEATTEGGGKTATPVHHEVAGVVSWTAFGAGVPEVAALPVRVRDAPRPPELGTIAPGERGVVLAGTACIAYAVQLLNAAKPDLKLRHGGKSFVDPVTRTQRVPDLLVFEGSRVVLVVEFKWDGTFHDNDLVRYYNVHQPRSVRAKFTDVPGSVVVRKCPITQLCTYMRLAKCRFGVISTYHHTFFVRVGRGRVLETSGCFYPGVEVVKIINVKKTVEGQEAFEKQTVSLSSMDNPPTPNPDNADPPPGPLTLNQALMWIIATSIEEGPDLPADFELSDVEESIRLGLEEQQGAARPPPRQGTRRSARGVSGAAASSGGAVGSSRSATTASTGPSTSVKLDSAPHKLIPVLGGRGAGFLDQDVAGKRCFIKFAEPEAQKELENEARVLRFLREHWGTLTPTLVAYGPVDRGQMALATTMEGFSMGRCTSEQAEAMRAALRKLHGLGVLHGDVALRNFVVNKEGVVKLIDFGRSKFVDEVVDEFEGECTPQDLFNKEMEQLDWEIDSWM